MAQMPEIDKELLLRAMSTPSLGQAIQSGVSGVKSGIDIGNTLANQKLARKKQEDDLMNQIRQLTLQEKQQGLREKESAAGMITPELSPKAKKEMTPEVYKTLFPEKDKKDGYGTADFIKSSFTGPDGKSYALWGRSGQVTEIPVTAAGPLVKPTAPGEMVQQFGDFETMLKQLDTVRKTWKPEFTGLGDVAKGEVSQTINQPGIGLGASQERADFNANVNSIRNQLLYLRSGKQINETEYKRMLKELPNEWKSDTDFQAKLNNFERVFKELMENRRTALGTAYSNVPQKPVQAQPTVPEVGGLTPEKKARLEELRAKKAAGTLR